MRLKMKQVLLHIVFLVFAPLLFGQQDTVHFPEAEIVSSYTIRNNDFSTITIDSLKKQQFTFQHLGNLLQAHTGGFIKGYGAGQIATISLRGTGASHTSVFWEGLNLQSASLGQVDFSTVPVWFFSEVDVNKGPSVNAGVGAANAGGLIQLQSNEHSNYVQAGLLRGSFGLQQQYGLLNQSKGKWRHRFGVSYDEAANNFVISETNQPQSNAATYQTNVIGKHSYFANNKNKVGLAYWLGNNNRKIPPTIGQPNSESKLDGSTFKSSLSWNHFRNSWRSIYSLGVIYDELLYADPDILLTSLTKGKTIQNNWTTEGELNKQLSWQTVVQHQFLSVNSSGYNKIKNQHRTYAGLSLNYLNKSHGISAGLGMHLINEMQRVPLPSIKYKYTIGSSWQLMAKYAGVYRAPTFNDLYWFPLGNPDLLPENGWSSEIGVSYIKHGKIGELSVQTSAFIGKINNWIIWLPVGGNWRPENKLQVKNNGVEFQLNWKKTIGQYKLIFDANTNYIVSRNLKSKFENDKSVGKQLIYVPFQSSFAAFGVSRKKIILNTSVQYTGARYVTADNSSALSAYTLLNIAANYSFTTKSQHLFKIGFTALNVLDTQYQPVLGRSMPGINYQVNFIYTLKNKSK